MSNAQEHIWAFDLGKASIGEAVRVGNEFKHMASLLIPYDFAETKSAANRRRMWRTREARLARGKWLETVWEAAGFEVLRGRQLGKLDEKGIPIPKSEWQKRKGRWTQIAPADERLEREFSANGDDTCYTSCLLRIKLLRGEKLEQWQIYKALRSAIQKRGYDPKIAWAEKEARRAGKSVEEIQKEEEKKDAKYVEALNKWRQFKQDVPAEFHFPCYFDALKMGLWTPAKPLEIKHRIDHSALSTRNVRFDREDVEREVKQLALQADRLLDGKLDTARKKLIEQFKADRLRRIHAINERRKAKNTTRSPKQQKRLLDEPSFKHIASSIAEFLCHGPTGVAYASFDAQLRKDTGVRQGTNDDWMGALGQKIPRFDNRILDDCVLIPRYHVCKADIRLDKESGVPFPESLLPAEVTFLMKLKNTLVSDGSGQRKLRVEEVRKIFNTVSADVLKVKPDVKDWHRKIAECFKLTKSDWGKTKGIKELELRPLPNHEEVKAPKDSGRSRFSRPALRLMKELILSGKSPKEFYDEHIAKLNGHSDPKKGLVRDDLKFLLDMGDSWDTIHVPTQKLDALAARHTEDGKLDRDAAVSDLLGRIKDPVVRHRLSVFADRLRVLHQQLGMPGQVVLEFVREDFMGEVRKRELFNFQREREKNRKEAREKASEAGANERSAPLKYELWKAQGGTCLYTGQSLPFTNLDNYCVEHIVPRNHRSGVIGPDAMVNYVLTTHEVNEAKDNRTPFEWFHEKRLGDWDAYVQRVKSRATDLRNKKVQLLIQENAPELVGRYTALAETAWVAKLAQTIASLMFGWTNGCNADGFRCVTIVSGGLTARIRRKYRLNELLNPCPAGEDPLLWEEKCEKNRDDDRHHALDAMVISFIPGWARDHSKEHFFRFPPEIHKNARAFFERHLDAVKPCNLAIEMPAFEETLYGERVIQGHRYIVGREPLPSIAIKTVQNRESLKKRDDIELHRIVDHRIRRDVETFWNANPSATLEQWKAWCLGYRLGSNGSRVEAVLVTKSKADAVEEYCNVSKDADVVRGQFKRGAKHRGYFIYERPAPTKKEPNKTQIEVRPVFVFENKQDVLNDLTMHSDWKVHGFFESGCQVRTDRGWEFQGDTYEPDEFILGSVWANRNAKLWHPKHGEVGPVGLRILLNAGFQRVASFV